MTNEQRQEALAALAMLDQVAATAPVNRVAHIQAQQAVATIREALTPEPAKESK